MILERPSTTAPPALRPYLQWARLGLTGSWDSRHLRLLKQEHLLLAGCGFAFTFTAEEGAKGSSVRLAQAQEFPLRNQDESPIPCSPDLQVLSLGPDALRSGCLLRQALYRGISTGP